MSWRVLMELAEADVVVEDGGCNIRTDRNESAIGVAKGRTSTEPSETTSAQMRELKPERKGTRPTSICVASFWIH